MLYFEIQKKNFFACARKKFFSLKIRSWALDLGQKNLAHLHTIKSAKFWFLRSERHFEHILKTAKSQKWIFEHGARASTRQILRAIKLVYVKYLCVKAGRCAINSRGDITFYFWSVFFPRTVPTRKCYITYYFQNYKYMNNECQITKFVSTS